MLSGVRCLTAVEALFDEVATARSDRDAVAAVDMAAAAELVSVRMLREYVASVGRRRGIGRVRRALELADEDSRSPTETWMRLIWMLDAGLSRPLCNRAVYDLDGRLLGAPDLLDPVAGVAGEYDGDEHRFAVRRARDAEKDDLYRRLGREHQEFLGSLHRGVER